jgi:predicted Zn-dependent peptidase
MKSRAIRSLGAWALGLAIALALTTPAGAGQLQQLRDSVREITLQNGLRILVVERHDAPVFAYATCVDAGTAYDLSGQTGLAHMFEHEAFKGTQTIGTTDYKAEEKALAKVDAAWDAIVTERARSARADSTRLAELQQAFDAAQAEALAYVVPNEFSTILDRNGVRGMNAFTANDMTCYYYSLPSNRLELCARMEGDRLSRPVLREFYTERNVVRNERRMRIESSPMGRLYEDFMAAAFKSHPYRNLIGNAADIENFRRRDAQAYFDKYYVARNMTVVLVGDVTVAEVTRLAGKYFGEIADAPDPLPVITVEAEPTSERRILAREDANPTVMIGWLGPSGNDPDYPAMELLMAILGDGRTSRLNERLVKQEKVATMAGAGTGAPGEKYPNLSMVFLNVAAGEDPLRAEEMAYEEIARLAEEGPSAAELEKVKTRYLADTIRQLRQPSRFAMALAVADQIRGGWTELFDNLDRVSAVTAADVQRLAREKLTPERRTAAILMKKNAGNGGTQG